MTFPEGFTWGTATSAYQIEGAAQSDGKGLSVWDMLCRRPGAIYAGHTGEVANDHYHRYNDDVALMAELGMKAYRFSISWPRVIPNGTGDVNAAGLDYYDRLVDALLEKGIRPFVTLFHWDYPYALYCRGGWLNPYSSDWFADYATVMVDRLSDRVSHWMTLNEPQVFIMAGHHQGRHAPGDKLDWPQLLRITHNTLLAHGKAVQVIRARAQSEVQVGFAPVGVTFVPASNDPADVSAAQEATFGIFDPTLWNNTWYTEPIFNKRYPADGLRLFAPMMPDIGADDMDIIGQPVDFYGCNIYHAQVVRSGAAGPELVDEVPGNPQTAFRWPVRPASLYWGPRFFYERYGKPIYITENGLSSMDWVALDGHVHDPQRIDFLTRYLMALRGAIRAGADVRGYFQWSFMDNFEWAEGYRERFGLVYVDFATQQRIPKDSAYWYRDLANSNGGTLPEGDDYDFS